MAKHFITSLEDLCSFGLVDLPNLHPYWRSLIERVHFAVSQRYPDGEFGARHIVDVLSYVDADGHKPVAMTTYSRGGVYRPYTFYTREVLGLSSHLGHQQEALRVGILDRFNPPADRPDLAFVLHEALHPVVKRARRTPGFLAEVYETLQPILGVQWRPDLHFDPRVQAAIKKHCSIYAATSPEDFLVEALCNALMYRNPIPVALAVRNAMDRRFRFDAPGIDAHVNCVLGEYERVKSLPYDLAEQVRTVRPQQLAGWQVHRHKRRFGRWPQVPFIPLDISGVLTGEYSLYITDAQMTYRSAELPLLGVEVADIPEADFARVMWILAKQNTRLRWGGRELPPRSGRSAINVDTSAPIGPPSDVVDQSVHPATRDSRSPLGTAETNANSGSSSTPVTDFAAISLPVLLGDAQMLAVGVNHTAPDALRLIASQLRALNVKTLYIEAENAAVLGELNDGVQTSIGALRKGLHINADGRYDLVLAAASLDVRVVGIDDDSLFRLVTTRGPSGSDPWPQERYESAREKLAADRTMRMAKAIRDDQARLRANGRGDSSDRSLIVVGAKHVFDMPMPGEYSAVVPGVGTSLRSAGMKVVDVLQVGDLDEPPRMFQQGYPAQELFEADRAACFTVPFQDVTDRHMLHLPERPVSGWLLSLAHDRPQRIALDEAAQTFVTELSPKDPRAHFLSGYMRQAAMDFQSADDFQEGAKAGDPALFLEEARMRMLAATLAGQPDQREKAAVAFNHAIEAGVPGAARIAAGHFQSVGDVGTATAMTLLADIEELQRPKLWPADRTPLRRQLTREVEKTQKDAGKSPIPIPATKTLPATVQDSPLGPAPAPLVDTPRAVVGTVSRVVPEDPSTPRNVIKPPRSAAEVASLPASSSRDPRHTFQMPSPVSDTPEDRRPVVPVAHSVPLPLGPPPIFEMNPLAVLPASAPAEEDLKVTDRPDVPSGRRALPGPMDIM